MTQLETANSALREAATDVVRLSKECADLERDLEEAVELLEWSTPPVMHAGGLGYNQCRQWLSRRDTFLARHRKDAK